MTEQHGFPYDYPAHDFEPSADAPTACQICADFAAEHDAEPLTIEAAAIAASKAPPYVTDDDSAPDTL